MSDEDNVNPRETLARFRATKSPELLAERNQKMRLQIGESYFCPKCERTFVSVDWAPSGPSHFMQSCISKNFHCSRRLNGMNGRKSVKPNQKKKLAEPNRGFMECVRVGVGRKIFIVWRGCNLPRQ